MGEGKGRGMRRGALVAWITVIVTIVALQSIAHLALALGSDRIGTLLDLDRSNGLPDLVSTACLAIAAAGAAAVARRETRSRLLASGLAAVLIATLTLADLFHDGAHPSVRTGQLVIALVVGTVGLLAFIAVEMGVRARAMLAVGAVFLAGSLLIDGLDRVDGWFERERGDAVAELQIAAKEGLELLGWSLVALALWDEAVRLRNSRGDGVTAPTAPASRGRAASRRRAA